jgi:hypothetical protein
MHTALVLWLNVTTLILPALRVFLRSSVGLDDAMILFPGFRDRFPDAYGSFISLFHRVSESRWGGSVNCRFYGAQRIRVDEGALGPLASVVMGLFHQLAPDSQLGNCPVLQRLAQLEPVTGGALHQAALRTVKNRQG